MCVSIIADVQTAVASLVILCVCMQTETYTMRCYICR